MGENSEPFGDETDFAMEYNRVNSPKGHDVRLLEGISQESETCDILFRRIYIESSCTAVFKTSRLFQINVNGEGICFNKTYKQCCFSFYNFSSSLYYFQYYYFQCYSFNSRKKFCTSQIISYCHILSCIGCQKVLFLLAQIFKTFRLS